MIKIPTNISEEVQELIEYAKTYVATYGVAKQEDFKALTYMDANDWSMVMERAMRAKLQEATIGFSINPWHASAEQIAACLSMRFSANKSAFAEISSEFSHEVVYRIVSGWIARFQRELRHDDIWTLQRNGPMAYDLVYVANKHVVEKAVVDSGGNFALFLSAFY